MERCLPAAMEGRVEVSPMAKSEISPFLIKKTGTGLALWPLSLLPNGCCVPDEDKDASEGDEAGAPC